MKTFFISDLHLFHKNILLYQPTRNFKTVEEMNEAIVSNWNKVVTRNDRVFLLGDVGFGNKKEKQIEKIMEKLNGNIILILGGHDYNLSTELKQKLQAVDYKRIKVEGNHLILFHYPISTWEAQYHGSIQLHGHVHNKYIPFQKNQYNVSIEVLDFTPCELTDVIEKNKTWREKQHTVDYII